MRKLKHLTRELDLLGSEMKGAQYTWTNNQINPIPSKLERFLVSWEAERLWGNLNVTAVPRFTSDHCTLLSESSVNKRRKFPSRFFLSWFLATDLPARLEYWWEESQTAGLPGYGVWFKHKFLKGKLKQWHKEEFPRNLLLKDIQRIDVAEENRGVSQKQRQTRINEKLNLDKIFAVKKWIESNDPDAAGWKERTTKFFHVVT